MASIDHIVSGFYHIPLKQTLVDARHGLHHLFEVITVQVTDTDGATGTGYTFTGGHNGGAIYDIVRREFPLLAVGEDADLIEQIWEKIWWASHYGGKGGPTVLALSALDIALWDLKAKRAGLPLWKLLGGHSPLVQCYAGGIDLHLSPDELLLQSDHHIKTGFRAIKMKVGRDRLSEDVEKLKAMRTHLGDEFPLMVDANMKWTVSEAIRAAQAFGPYDPLWLEEPIIPDDFEGMARVTQEGGLPLAMGENFRTLWEFRHAMSLGKVGFPEPDVTNCGGVTQFIKVAHLAESFNLPVTSHGAHDITVHLLAAVPNASYLEAHGFGLEDYLKHPFELRDGMAVAPDRPGHGMEFDWAALAPRAVATT